jgi:DNA-3-methyladenine glycosylase II
MLRGRAPQRLTAETLAAGVAELAGRDPDLALIAERYGMPPLWAREHGFHTLVQVILEQQVSLASAAAVYQRLLAAAMPLTPESFLRLDEAALRGMGFSRQKAGYCRGLAHQVLIGELDLDALPRLGDEAVRATLLNIKGVGPWTAEIYLLMALGQPDAWPAGDLALAVAVHEIKRLESRPTPVELERSAEGWRPLRAIAARLLWQYYLSRPTRGNGS